MSYLTKTMKLHMAEVDIPTSEKFMFTMNAYCDACDYVSQYIFNHNFELTITRLHDALYYTIRQAFGLKSQMAESVVKTVVAKYKTIETQLGKNPFKYKDKNGKWHYVKRMLDWLTKPVHFSTPQLDLVYGRDYSFTGNPNELSINTIDKRVKVKFDRPNYYKDYFSDDWKFGTAKLIYKNKKWFLHIAMTNVHEIEEILSYKHIVGCDRGLRFPIVTYDENKHSTFVNGKEIAAKKKKFNRLRSELQASSKKGS